MFWFNDLLFKKWPACNHYLCKRLFGWNMFNQMGTTTPYTLLCAIGEYDQTDTLLPTFPSTYAFVTCLSLHCHFPLPIHESLPQRIRTISHPLLGNVTASLGICKKRFAWSWHVGIHKKSTRANIACCARAGWKFFLRKGANHNSRFCTRIFLANYSRSLVHPCFASQMHYRIEPMFICHTLFATQK